MHNVFSICLMLFTPLLALAQPQLSNPSFEGPPGIGTLPSGWFFCFNLSTPDTQPGFHDVDLPPTDGSSYLGLVGRGGITVPYGLAYNGTVEDARTLLSSPLEAGVFYKLEIDLAHEPEFTSYSLADNVDYPFPMQLEVYGTFGECDSGELLWRSPVIDHPEWRTYEAELLPLKGPYNYLMLQAAFPDGVAVLGNVNLDHLRLTTLGPIAPQWQMPNVFSPNGDGINDFFQPFDLTDISGFEVVIFDRWGRKMYQGPSAWDGTFEGRPCPEGVYFYELKVVDLIGRQQRQTGSCTLVR